MRNVLARCNELRRWVAENPNTPVGEIAGRAASIEQLSASLTKIRDKNYYLKKITDRFSIMNLDALKAVYEAAFDRTRDDPGRNLIGDFHAVDKLEPLRKLINDKLDVNLVKESKIQLRVGAVDAQTGRMFHVTEPQEGLPDGFGIIELENDFVTNSDENGNHLSFGDDRLMMRLKDAVYCSSSMPIFMEPPILTPGSQRVEINGQFFRELSMAFPEQVLSLMDDGERNRYQRPSGTNNDRHVFDGGLRDINPIRTAMRLGARNIIVVTAESLSQTHWMFKSPGETPFNISDVPVSQYLDSLIEMWGNDVHRNDILLALAANEFTGWLRKCFTLMDEDSRSRIMEEFNTYWSRKKQPWLDILGSTTWIGGSDTFQGGLNNPYSSVTNTIEGINNPYIVPFYDEGCSISIIAPPGPISINENGQDVILKSTDFEAYKLIRKGLEFGYIMAAKTFDQILSNPFSDTDLRRN